MTQELMKVKIDYAQAAEILKTSLKMKGSPVAVGFATTKDDIPQGIPELDKTIKHCMMVSLARNEGRIFYSTTEKHECMGGAYALGFKDLTPTLKSGQFYFKLGKFESVTSSKRTMESVPHLPTGETYATMYAPLEKTPFVPQVIVIITNPWSMLKLAQSSLFRMGGRIHASFSGIQSVCSDSVAQTVLTGKPNFSLGCDGSRKFSGIADDEMVMGIPAEMLPEIVDALKIVTQAPGSKKP
jgi:uncharacterized protein (DUF169 family)